MLHRSSITTPEELIEEAKDLNINISSAARNGIRMAIARRKLLNKHCYISLEAKELKDRVDAIDAAYDLIIEEGEE